MHPDKTCTAQRCLPAPWGVLGSIPRVLTASVASAHGPEHAASHANPHEHGHTPEEATQPSCPSGNTNQRRGVKMMRSALYYWGGGFRLHLPWTDGKWQRIHVKGMVREETKLLLK